MKRWMLPLAILAVVAILAATVTLVRPTFHTRRGVRVTSPAARGPLTFEREQSAALFVGVRTFTHPETVEVRYAADDAVDLAYLFALDPRVNLVPADRVVLALAGKPTKKESCDRLQKLKEAGAMVEAAGQADILALLQRQAAMAGEQGILIVALATHGFSKDGVPFVLGSTSVFPRAETALPMPTLFEIASKSAARRSLFFIDACRERITKGTRGGKSPATRAPRVGRMGRVEGQVVFSAAAAGGYSYDGDGNGVFTKAVIDGLSCGASLTRGFVTVETLRTFVERNVLRWIRQNRDESIRVATQIIMDGASKNMRLSTCELPPSPSPPDDVARVKHEGSIVTAFSANGARLWQHDLNAGVIDAKVADLDADGSHEVVAGANTITVLNRRGIPVGSAGEGMTLRKFVVDDLLLGSHSMQIVALWDDERSPTSRVSIHSANGRRLSAYDHYGRLQDIAVDRPTARHGRKIIVAGVDDRAGASFGINESLATVFTLGTNSKLAWAGVLFPPTERITRLQIIDYDNDAKRDISISTTSGAAIALDFSGNVLANSSPRVTFRIVRARR